MEGRKEDLYVSLKFIFFHHFFILVFPLLRDLKRAVKIAQNSFGLKLYFCPKLKNHDKDRR